MDNVLHALCVYTYDVRVKLTHCVNSLPAYLWPYIQLSLFSNFFIMSTGYVTTCVQVGKSQWLF